MSVYALLQMDEQLNPTLSSKNGAIQRNPGNSVYKCRKEEKQCAENVSLHKLSSGATHDAAFISIQDNLMQTVRLAFSKGDHAIRAYTDAYE